MNSFTPLNTFFFVTWWHKTWETTSQSKSPYKVIISDICRSNGNWHLHLHFSDNLRQGIDLRAGDLWWNWEQVPSDFQSGWEFREPESKYLRKTSLLSTGLSVEYFSLFHWRNNHIPSIGFRDIKMIKTQSGKAQHQGCVGQICGNPGPGPKCRSRHGLRHLLTFITPAIGFIWDRQRLLPGQMEVYKAMCQLYLILRVDKLFWKHELMSLWSLHCVCQTSFIFFFSQAWKGVRTIPRWWAPQRWATVWSWLGCTVCTGHHCMVLLKS